MDNGRRLISVGKAMLGSSVTGFGESSCRHIIGGFLTRLSSCGIDATALPNRAPKTEPGRFKHLRDAPVVWDNDF